MSEQAVRVTGDSGSPERVAYDLMKHIIYVDRTDAYATKQAIIDLYVDCLWATRLERAGGR